LPAKNVAQPSERWGHDVFQVNRDKAHYAGHARRNAKRKAVNPNRLTASVFI
jgi:hypothetical protein